MSDNDSKPDSELKPKTSWSKDPAVLAILTVVLASFFVFLLTRPEVKPIIYRIDIYTAKLFGLCWSLPGLEISVEYINVSVTFRNVTKIFLIGYGCDGVLAYLILCCAIITIPCTIKNKVKGLALGCLFVILMNQIRLIGLMGASFVFGQNIDFVFLHTVLGQIFALVMIFWYWRYWVSGVMKSEAKVLVASKAA